MRDNRPKGSKPGVWRWSSTDQPPTDIRTCGRPTRSTGKPCRNPLYGNEVACATHITARERELAEAYRRGHNEGFQQGWERGAATAAENVTRLERRVRELKQQLETAMRVDEVDGDQIVTVDIGGKEFAYRWGGEPPLRVGEKVLVPENWLSRHKHGPGPIVGTVTGFGTTYRGELSSIIRRAPTQEL